jgi:hypothetical protein
MQVPVAPDLSEPQHALGRTSATNTGFDGANRRILGATNEGAKQKRRGE